MNAVVRNLALALTLFGAAPALAHKAPKSGTFTTINAPTTGTATLVKTGKTYTVKLTDLKTAVGPALQVWLYGAPAPAKGTKDADIAAAPHVVLGQLKTFSGDFSFAVPAGTKVSDYPSVVLFCTDVKTAFASAPLK